MGLIFTGNYGFSQTGVPKWQDSTWDLDQLVVPWRGSIEGLEAFLDSHPVGEASSVDGNMFLMQKPTDDHKQFPTVLLTYQGKRGGVLPPIRHESDRDRLSASSKRGSNGAILAQPLILDFYAPTSIISYYSFGGEGSIEADDPTAAIEPITETCFDQTFTIGPLIETTLLIYFSVQIVKSFRSVEVVPSRWWQNTSKKTKLYSPFIFTAPASGPFVSLYSPGTGYQVGDNLSATFQGQNVQMHVTQVLSIWGDPTNAGVYRWDVTLNTFTEPVTALPMTGGTGTGCAVNIMIIP